MAGSNIFPVIYPTLPVLPVTTPPFYDVDTQTSKRITPMIIFRQTQKANKPPEEKPVEDKKTLPVIPPPPENKILAYIVIGLCALIVLNTLGKRK